MSRAVVIRWGSESIGGVSMLSAPFLELLFLGLPTRQRV